MMKHHEQNIPMKLIQKISAILNCMLQILPDNEIAEGINSLNPE